MPYLSTPNTDQNQALLISFNGISEIISAPYMFVSVEAESNAHFSEAGAG